MSDPNKLIHTSGSSTRESMFPRRSKQRFSSKPKQKFQSSHRSGPPRTVNHKDPNMSSDCVQSSSKSSMIGSNQSYTPGASSYSLIFRKFFTCWHVIQSRCCPWNRCVCECLHWPSASLLRLNPLPIVLGAGTLQRITQSKAVVPP